MIKSFFKKYKKTFFMRKSTVKQKKKQYLTGETVFLDVAATLAMSIILGSLLICGIKGIMKYNADPKSLSEGRNLTIQLHNELTTQVVDAPFDKWERFSKIVEAIPAKKRINLWIDQKYLAKYRFSKDYGQNVTIKWSSADPNIASVDSNGLITGVSSGDTIVYLTTDTGARTKIFVHVEAVSVTLAHNITIYISQTVKIPRSVTPPYMENSLSWSSDSPQIASVDSTGQVTGNSVGRAYITATTVSGTKDTCCVNVEDVSVTLAHNITIDIYHTIKIPRSVTPPYMENLLSWNTDSPQIASVDSTGQVTGNSVGRAYVTATTISGTKDTCCVTVVDRRPAAPSIGASIDGNGYVSVYAYSPNATSHIMGSSGFHAGNGSTFVVSAYASNQYGSSPVSSRCFTAHSNSYSICTKAGSYTTYMSRSQSDYQGDPVHYVQQDFQSYTTDHYIYYHEGAAIGIAGTAHWSGDFPHYTHWVISIINIVQPVYESRTDWWLS